MLESRQGVCVSLSMCRQWTEAHVSLAHLGQAVPFDLPWLAALSQCLSFSSGQQASNPS